MLSDTLHSCLPVWREVTREILKASVLVNEGEAGSSYGPISLLANDNLRNTFHVLLVLVVHLLPVDEEDGVRVLLDRTGLTQVAHQGSFLGSLLEGSIELRKRKYRQTQFLCQCLE